MKQDLEMILHSKKQILSTMHAHDRQRENLKSKIMKEGKIHHLFILYIEQVVIIFHSLLKLFWC